MAVEREECTWKFDERDEIDRCPISTGMLTPLGKQMNKLVFECS
jgi:hypothetical protein